MDPQAVIANARGEIDEALLTRTDGGLLGRDVLADEPLLSHLRDDETLHYLLAGAAAPARVDGGRPEPVETAGSYRTLLAVTDARLLVVAGSRDGDRAFEFPYGRVLDVEHVDGLLTDTVAVHEAPARRWEIEVGAGSEPAAAVAYARERLAAADATGAGAEAELVDAVFEALVGDSVDVEGYGGDLASLVEDLQAHQRRLRDHLDAGERGAARAAAATVDALAREGERLAGERGRPEAGRRIAAIRAGARRALVAAEFGVDAADLGGAPRPALRRLLQALDARDFEHLVADVWSELGYQTAVTRSSGDEGIDVVARRTAPVEETVLVQAKRYGPDTKVGREAIQQYASLHRQERDADLVVVVTTGAFTRPAREAAAALNVKLVDGDRLAGIVAENGLYDLVAEYVG